MDTANRGYDRDWRMKYIFFMDRHKIRISLTFNIILMVITACAATFELDVPCCDDVKLWLSISSARSIVRFVLDYTVYKRSILQPHANNLVTRKIVEMLDIFGMVWFSIGCLIVFNSLMSFPSVPFVFSASIFYLSSVIIMSAIGMFVRASLVCQPPRSQAGLPFHATNNEGAVAPAAAQQDWKSWLESYNCYEFRINEIQGLAEYKGCHQCPICLTDFTDPFVESTLNASNPVSVKNKILNTSSIDIKVSENVIEEGDVKLESVNSRDVEVSTGVMAEPFVIVVSYPCSARHLFHPECLHPWLASAILANRSHRLIRISAANLTCPLCREAPSQISNSNNASPGDVSASPNTWNSQIIDEALSVGDLSRPVQAMEVEADSGTYSRSQSNNSREIHSSHI